MSEKQPPNWWQELREELREKAQVDWRKAWERLRHLQWEELDEQLREQFAWFWQRYKPARLLSFVGILVTLVGILGTGISLAMLGHFLVKYQFDLWKILKEARFELMVNVVRVLLFLWVFGTGFGIFSRKRWAGVSCMIGYVFIETQSVYVAEHFWASVVLSLSAFLVCFVVQLHWETLMVHVEGDELPLECNHAFLTERAKGFTFWGYYTYCPGCHKKVVFWDNLLAPLMLLFLSLSWAAWWYWPFWPLSQWLSGA